jgi:hypothetical protein
MSWCSDAPEDEAISLFAGLLANPDVPLSRLLSCVPLPTRLSHTSSVYLYLATAVPMVFREIWSWRVGNQLISP